MLLHQFGKSFGIPAGGRGTSLRNQGLSRWVKLLRQKRDAQRDEAESQAYLRRHRPESETRAQEFRGAFELPRPQAKQRQMIAGNASNFLVILDAESLCLFEVLQRTIIIAGFEFRKTEKGPYVSDPWRE